MVRIACSEARASLSTHGLLDENERRRALGGRGGVVEERLACVAGVGEEDRLV